MSLTIELKNISKNYLGFSCDQCGINFVFLEGACNHEGDIADNNGVCPNLEQKEDE